MKKYPFIALFVLAALCCACQEKEPVWVEPVQTMFIEQANLVFTPAAGSSSFLVKAEKSFTAQTDRDWCTATVSGSEVTVNVTDNGSNETRYARVTLVCGDETLGITVHQAGLILKGFTVTDQVVSSKQQVLKFPYSANGPLSVSTNEAWIGVALNDSLVTISVAENTGSMRTGQIEYAFGDRSGSFSIIQNPLFRVLPDWEPAYAGKTRATTYTCENFSVSVAAASIGQPYAITLVPESDFIASGQTMSDYVADVVWKKALAELELIIEESEGTLKLGDLLLTDSATAEFPASDIPAGSWYVIAVGLNPDAIPTGFYSAALVQTTPRTYASWLGTWTATDAQGVVSTLEIAQKESGASYTITGLKGYNFPVSAKFTPADGTFTITGSSTVSLISSDYTEGQYVFKTLYLLGLFTNGSSSYYRTGASSDVALGSRIDDNKAQITGYWTTASSGDWCIFNQLVFRGLASKSGATATNTVLARNYLPIVLTR